MASYRNFTTGLLFVGLGAAAVLSGATPAPSTYTAVTDLAARPEPAPPALGAAGFSFKDPTFGSRILRVTDNKSQANALNDSFRTPALSWMNNWNADSTMFWVLANGGILPYRFDPATMKATRISKASDPSGGLFLPFSGPFSYSKPNILYGTVGMTIVQYDFNTNTQTTVFDAKKAVSSASQYAHVPSVSDDDTKLCLAFGGTQGTFPYVAVLDRTKGVYHLLDAKNSRIDGKAANQTLGYGLYSALIDRTGQYVMLLTGNGSLSAVWDVQNVKVYAASAQNAGSPAAGFRAGVNLSGYPAYSEPIEWSGRSLDQANVNNAQYLLNPSSLPSPHQSIYDGRVSWNNAQSGVLVPVVGSVNRDVQATSAPSRAWDNEIIATATDGSGKVWRFAHHQSDWDTTSSNDLARGNVSQDGRWYAFMSNWGKKLGVDPSGGPRQDVFIVDLKSANAADATIPSVSITAPAQNTTVTGTVTVQASASDPAGIAGVQFRLDGSNLGAEVTVAPYTTSWDTTKASAGTHSLTAIARDLAGNLGTSAVVSVSTGDKTAPTISISSPVSGSTVSGLVSVAATASDNSGVAGVQFYVDGAALGAEDTVAPYAAPWDTSKISGSHTLTAIARDAAGNRTTSAAVSVTVQHTGAPTVAITAPANAATVSGTVTVTAAASDSLGISGVQFMLNGAPLGTRDTTAPYSIGWNTTSVANGSYTLTAQATDTVNLSATSAAVTVTVNNATATPAPGTPALTSPSNNATSVATTSALTWSAAANAASYDVYIGTTAPPPFVANTTSTSYAPGSMFAATTYYWYVVAKNSAGKAASATWSFTTAASSSGGGGTGSVLSYTSPSCGPSGGTTSWACGPWPSSNAPLLGPAGTTTRDPDTGNRVLRVTQSGSFGEAPSLAFKVFDGGWRQAWNANDTRILVQPWNTGLVNHAAYWVGFNAASMSLTGASGFIPVAFNDFQWDQNDPDAIVGIVNGVAQSYNIVTGAYTKVFDPASTGWGGTTWLSSWGGPSVCVAEGPQDVGYRLACYNGQTKSSQTIDLHSQTINGQRFNVYFQGSPVTLPSSVGVHTITMGLDGRWLAIDTHGNSMCSIGGLNNYGSTAVFIDLQNKVGYEWNVACGQTHWAYGYNSVMMQSASSKWTSTGANNPCNSDSRGIGRRSTDGAIDSSYVTTQPCTFFNPATWNISVHLSWTNNFNDANVNKYPVLMATSNEGVSNMFLYSDIAAMETSAAPFQGRIWRFAQTWNDQTQNQCGLIGYASPSISRSGRFAIFPSNWRGQTGSNGVCTNGKRTDVFLFELK